MLSNALSKVHESAVHVQFPIFQATDVLLALNFVNSASASRAKVLTLGPKRLPVFVSISRGVCKYLVTCNVLHKV